MTTFILNPYITLLTLTLIHHFHFQAAALTADGLSLLAFKSAVTSDPTSILSGWNEDDTDPCRWPGISCANISGFPEPRVVGIAVSAKNLSGYIPSELGTLVFLRRLNLHGNRLSGSIPAQLFNASSLHSIFLYGNNLSGMLPPSLCDLPRLQNLDLSRNSLSGPIPFSLRNCGQLQRLVLGGNRMSGRVPTGIWPAMLNLVQLDLSSNRLDGPLPPDIGDLSSLTGTLNLSHNGFSGEIPGSLGNLPTTVSLDLRYNNLSGEVPDSLADRGPAVLLYDNPALCGFPLQDSCVSTASPVPQLGTGGRKKALKPSRIVIISVADATGVAVIGLVLVYLYWKMKDRADSRTGKTKFGEVSNGNLKSDVCLCFRSRRSSDCGDDDIGTDTETESGKLVSMDRGFKLELDELLRASAYVLGKGGLGIVYKVVLSNGVPVAVRRLGDNGGSGGLRWYKEFAAEMKEIGKVKHGNIVRLRAYYWAPDEKLLITDFVSNGNLASALKGRQGQPSLSWSIRLRIAKGAAHGLNYLHECSPRKNVHGHVKPSNILLDGDFNPYISDFGLFRLVSVAGNEQVSSTSSSSLGIIGAVLPIKPGPIERPNNYRAPEARLSGSRPTQKCDVYSFGMVLLELLTGKIAEMSSAATTSSSVVDPVPELVRWVRKGFEGANPLTDMVDPALHKEVHAKKEVLAVFQVALACTETDPELRPKMKTVADSLDRMGS